MEEKGEVEKRIADMKEDCRNTGRKRGKEKYRIRVDKKKPERGEKSLQKYMLKRGC